MDPLLREKAIREACMCVFYDVSVCVWAQQRPVHQSGNRGHINLICHNLSLETLGPPCPNTHPATRTHTQTLTPSCVLSVSATDRESEANYMWELRRWKRDKDRAGVCACAYVAFVWVLIYFTCPCCCYVWVTQITVTCPCCCPNFACPCYYVCVCGQDKGDIMQHSTFPPHPTLFYHGAEIHSD